MLSGVRFVPREQLDVDEDNKKKKKQRGRRKTRKSRDNDKYRRRKVSSSSEEDDSSSDDNSSSNDEKKLHRRGHHIKSHSKKKKAKKRRSLPSNFEGDDMSHSSSSSSDEETNGDGDYDAFAVSECSRREAGLDWMLRSASGGDTGALLANKVPKEPEEPHKDAARVNPKELNPYLKDNGGGYPDEASLGRNKLPQSSIVGDGGASWRLKALKRAKEHAAREGRKLNQVVEDRWGSLSQLAVSVASQRAAPSHAHLHAIKDRKKGSADSSLHASPHQKGEDGGDIKNNKKLEGSSSHHSEMRKPKSYSWRKDKNQHLSENNLLISDAISGLNKFANDGSFIKMISKNTDATASMPVKDDSESSFPTMKTVPEREPSVDKQVNTNKLAAKAFQLRLKGKHEEADVLLEESRKQKQTINTMVANPESSIRSIERKASCKRREEDADLFLAQKIARNKLYNISRQADDEYDYDDDVPKRRGKRKHANDPDEKNRVSNRLLTQEQRCQFCFENSTRPKHLVASIAQFTYLALPPWQPVVQGHCCILTMQHESSTRNVDDNIWEELRNFKKCLIMMFHKQDKEVVFLETVINLSRQQRHCLVECIPLPCEIAKQAPLYFKKAIDEAEEEWSQHNSKKLIRTSREKGLRRCIPKDFPYFHVEFGLDEGFVHVIDDEGRFKSGIGLNVIRGMLKLPEEDMYRRRRREEPIDKQRLAVAAFAQQWEPFDWTKQLHGNN